jgi:osmotically-inducible protein OsmY
MSIYDRPYFEGQRDRERERGSRERDRSFGRRGTGRRDFSDDDDDRGSWMSRDRDEFERGGRGYRDRDPFDPRQDEIRRGRQAFEPDFDPGHERQFWRERSGFDRFEDWERPREQRESSPLENSKRGSRAAYRGDYGFGAGESNRQARGSSFSMGHSAWEQRGSESQQRSGRFAGRGPKGYQRSDERLKEDLCDRLTADPEIDATEIEVLVQNGEVTLQGSVPERAMKRGAEDSAEEISGVQQVHNRLRVEARPSDEDDHGADRFGSKGREGQRSSAGRKAH